MNTLFANTSLAQFHFLRPLWLFALVPAFALAFALWRRKGSAANWRAAIAPDLIDYLLESAQQLRPQWPWLLLMGWLIAIFALAGPTWEKLPQPVLQKRDGLVIVLDLSLSMYAEDIKPSRLQRARFKVIDILQQRREGLTGLVVYSGDAHVVSPLTDDTATIANLVPALAPAIMPSFGSNVGAGIDTALQLLRNAGFEHGRILLISDDIETSDIDTIAAHIDGQQWQLAVIGVGTEQGAPIPLPLENQARDENQARAANQSGFLKQNNGTIAIAQLHRDRFEQLAAKTKGRYDDIRVDDADIAHVLPPVATTNDTMRTLEREFDQWRERSPQLVMLLLPLAAFAFRRGWLLILFLVPFSAPSHAWEWRDLWLRPDQQAQQEFNVGNSKSASEKFQDPSWRGAAQYRSGEFENAAQSLESVDSADAQYNRGNALAHSGKLQDAINAYDAALKKNASLEDAKANRDLVEKILKQQQQKDQQNNSSQQKKQDEKQPDSQQQNGQSQQDQAQKNQSQPQNGDSKQSQQKDADDSQQQSAQNKQKNDQSSGNSPDQKNQKNTEDRQQQKSAQQSAQEHEKQNQDKTDNAQVLQDDKQQDKSQQQDKDAQQVATDSNQPTPEQLTPEQQRQQRATEQWLRQIPDDPSGLLRRKFLYESRQREQQAHDDGKPLW